MGRALALALVIVLGCRAGSGVKDPAPATLDPAPATSPPPPPAPPPAAAPPHPAPPKRALVPGQGCHGFPDELPACRAMGAGCRLAPRPEVLPPSPCRNRGARCLDDQMPKSVRDPICSCTCSDEYERAQRAVDAEYARRHEEDRRSRCEQLVDLATGEVREDCSDPKLPQ